MEYVNAIISFSLDVNAVQMDSNPFKNWIKQRRQTRWNKRHFKPMLFKMLQSCGIDGMTLTKGTGLYNDDGHLYEEESYNLELVFAKAVSIDKLAREICHHFYQKTVLVREIDYTEVKLIPENEN